ncbi:TolC family protein [Chitinophaga vietnamensis]|uniref:TolC family protein n=1 Tax=Chitinophaga vietnamensis TaxID=2593957 RepID=UPI001178650C|nr:TolC family protein [Chitinophaga vietnamensis]
MRCIHLLLSMLSLSGFQAVHAQADTTQQGPFAFNLNDCIQYGLAHHHDVVNAHLDTRFSEEQVKEATGKLLPHAVITGGFNDNLKLATSLIPDIASGNYDKKIPVQFGTRFSSNVLGQANQTIFNSDYFLGLKAARVYTGLAEKSYTRTAIDTRVAITKAYYAVLTSQENIRLSQANLAQLRKTLEDTKSRYDAGVAERVDVDRITVSYNNILTQTENQIRLLVYTVQLLKFQMGMPQESQLTLRETVKDIPLESFVTDTSNYRVEDRVEYGIQSTQIALNELNLKSKRLGFLPSLNGFINYGYNYFSDKFGDLYKTGFGASTLGLSLSWPIFNGTERLHQIRENRITLEKSKNDLDYLAQQIKVEVKNANVNYQNNMALYATNKKNMDLTQGIYERIVLKFDQGVATSLDVISAESQLSQAQSDYVNAMLNALISKTDLDKATGRIR